MKRIRLLSLSPPLTPPPPTPYPQGLLFREADYMAHCSMLTEYGSQPALTTGDARIDSTSIERPPLQNALRALLFAPKACLLANTSACASGRIHGLDATLMGLTALTERYIGAAHALAIGPVESATADNPYFEFVFTAGRWDLHDGLRQLTDLMHQSVVGVAWSKARISGG